MTNLFWVGDGGLHTNIEDMVKWDQNFYEPRVGQNPEELLRFLIHQTATLILAEAGAMPMASKSENQMIAYSLPILEGG